jgi:hypothetical protein
MGAFTWTNEVVMTDENTEHNKPSEEAAIDPSEKGAIDPEGMARRKALATLAKHAAYTAPAVLAVLSISVSRAKAGSF